MNQPRLPCRRGLAVAAGGLALACAGAAFRTPGPAVAEDRGRAFAQTGGATTAVAIQPPIAFVGIGASIALFDVSDAGRPDALGTTLPLPGVAEDMAIHDGHLYVATLGAGDGARLHVFDVRRPREPVAVGAPLPLPGEVVGAVAAGFGHVVVTTAGGVVRADVKDPARPRFAAELPTGAPLGRRPSAADIAIAPDGIAWIARPWGLYTLDLADPSPWAVAEIHRRAARAVATLGPDTYVALDDGGLEVWRPMLDRDANDATDGVDPADVATIAAASRRSDVAAATGRGARRTVVATLPGFASAPRAIAAHGDTLYVVDDGGRRWRAFRVDAPAAPVLVAETPAALQTSARAAVAVAGGVVGVALERAGLVTAAVDIPARLGRPAVPVLPPVLHASLAGRRLHASAETAGLFVVDVDDPRLPRVAGALQAVAGHEGLVAVDPAGRVPDLRAVDGNPYGNRHAVAFRSTVAVDDLVFACTAQDGLLAIDVTTAAHPVIVGHLSDMPACHPGTDMLHRAGVLYLTTDDRKLAVVDVGAPAAMRWVVDDSAPPVVDVMALALDGEHLYAAGYSGLTTGVLHVLSTSDPLRPRRVASTSFPQAFTKLAVAYRRAYLSGKFGSVGVVDFAPPASLLQRPGHDGIVAGRLGIIDTLVYAAQADRLDTLLTSSAGTLLPVDRLALPWSGDDRIGESDVQVDAGRMAVLRNRAGLFTGVGPDGITDAPPFAAAPRTPAGPPPATAAPPAAICQPPARVVLVADAAAGRSWSAGGVGNGGVAGAALGAAIRAFVGAIDVGRIEVGLGTFDDQGMLVGMGRDAGDLLAAWEAAATAEAPATAGVQPGADAPTASAPAGRVDLGLDLAEVALSGTEGAATEGAAVVVSVGRRDPADKARAIARAAELRAAGVAVYAVVVGPNADTSLADHLAGAPDRARVAADHAALAGVLQDVGAAATGCAGR